jgi:hypothetical protein
MGKVMAPKTRDKNLRGAQHVVAKVARGDLQTFFNVSPVFSHVKEELKIPGIKSADHNRKSPRFINSGGWG